MSDLAIFILGCCVFGVVIASTLVAVLTPASSVRRDTCRLPSVTGQPVQTKGAA